MTVRSVPPSSTPNEKQVGPLPLTGPDPATDSGMMAAMRARRLHLAMPHLERLCRPQSERLWVIGGSPGNFKTQLVWTLALNAAKLHQRVLFVSLEQTVGEMAMQAISRFAGIGLERVLGSIREKDGVPLSPEDKARVDAAVLEFSSLELYLRMHGADEHGRDSRHVLASATRATFDVVIVDHLRMMGGPGDETGRVADAIDAMRALCRGEVRRGYRPLVIVVSPLNRAPIKESETDEPRAPRLSDFWGSSKIEFHADVAMILQKRRKPKDDLSPCAVDAFVLKNRQGPAPAVVQLEADGARCLVTERHKDEDAAADPHWSDR